MLPKDVEPPEPEEADDAGRQQRLALPQHLSDDQQRRRRRRKFRRCCHQPLGCRVSLFPIEHRRGRRRVSVSGILGLGNDEVCYLYRVTLVVNYTLSIQGRPVFIWVLNRDFVDNHQSHPVTYCNFN